MNITLDRRAWACMGGADQTFFTFVCEGSFEVCLMSFWNITISSMISSSMSISDFNSIVLSFVFRLYIVILYTDVYIKFQCIFV